jgi:hypothetical protein
MKKDTFYFSHDYNAHDDVKVLFLRQELGMEGYGIFWFLIEKLADAGGILPLNLTPVLAMQMHTSETKVLGVINQYGLFNLIENDFYSERLLDHLNIRKRLSESGKNGAEKRWGYDRVANGGANSLPNGDGNAKERKGKEIKENSVLGEKIEEHTQIQNSNLFRQPNIPTKEQVWEFFHGAKATKEMAKAFYDKYDGTGWFINGSPIVKWQAFANNFITNWNKIEEQKKTKNNFQQPDPTKIKIKLPNSPTPRYD